MYKKYKYLTDKKKQCGFIYFNNTARRFRIHHEFVIKIVNIKINPRKNRSLQLFSFCNINVLSSWTG